MHNPKLAMVSTKQWSLSEGSTLLVSESSDSRVDRQGTPRGSSFFIGLIVMANITVLGNLELDGRKLKNNTEVVV